MALLGALEPPSRLVRAVADPIDFFFAEHQRHRQFCRLLDALAVAPDFEASSLQAALDFCLQEIPRHFAEEEETLFQALRRRALPEDEVSVVLERLHDEHRADADRVRRLCQGLQTCLGSRLPPSSSRDVKQALQDQARHELNHLALENAVVLPIARLRLEPSDLAQMSEQLAVPRRP